jgi:glucosamine-6-phosphate deaminase
MIKVIEADNYLELSEKAAAFVIRRINHNPGLVLGLATGSTPIGTYKEITAAVKENKVSFQHVKTVNLDEYIGLKKTHPNSYHTYMNEKLFNGIDLPKDQRFIPNGLSQNLKDECRRYDQVIQSLGGIDLQLLGIGRNGHIGFNEPGTSFETRTHIVELTVSTQKANARFFDSRDEVPSQAITMGIQSIMESGEILLLASGKKKAKAVAKLLKNKNAELDFPASVLNTHQNVTMIADCDALSLVEDMKREAKS